MTRLRTFVLASVSLGVAFVAADAQGPELATRRARLQRELDAATFAAVTKIVDGAPARGIPVEPLVNRALEGLTMKRPAPVIRSSVEKLAQRLEAARAALAPATPADVQAGAEALGVGVPATTLKEIRAVSPEAPLAVPLGVLTQLVASKVPVAKASAQVLELMRNRTRPEQLYSLSDDVARDVAIGGLDPEKALDVRVIGILSGSGTTATSANSVPAGLQNSGNFDGRNNNATGAPKTSRPARKP